MTRVDFYQIESDEAPLLFTCRLVDKAWRQGKEIYVHTSDQQIAVQLDELLWTFRPDRLVPHRLKEEGDAPVQIGWDDNPGRHHDLLINLSGLVPEFFSRFERLAEVVPREASDRTAARANYRFYKDRGYELNYHQMKAQKG